MVRRGEIHWVELDPVRGSERGGLRPPLVVQQDVGYERSPTTVVAAVTRTVPVKPYPFVVVLEPAESGLGHRCAVNRAQLATIQQEGPRSRLRPPRGEERLRPFGRLGPSSMLAVDRTLRYNLGLE